MAVNNYDIIVAINSRWNDKSLSNTVTGGLAHLTVGKNTSPPYCVLTVYTNTRTLQANTDANNMAEIHEVPFEHGAARVMTLVNLDDRRDKQATAQGTVDSVRAKL